MHRKIIDAGFEDIKTRGLTIGVFYTKNIKNNILLTNFPGFYILSKHFNGILYTIKQYICLWWHSEKVVWIKRIPDGGELWQRT